MPHRWHAMHTAYSHISRALKDSHYFPQVCAAPCNPAPLLAGSPTAPLSAACRAAVADLFGRPDCASPSIVECTTQSAVIFQWRLLCMSHIVKGSITSLLPSDIAKGRIDWAEAHPTVSSYMDLWQSPYDGAYGPVARQVLKQSSQTKLMVFELAQAPNIDQELQVRRLVWHVTS